MRSAKPSKLGFRMPTWWSPPRWRTETSLPSRAVSDPRGSIATPQGTIPPNGQTIDLGFADFFIVNHGKIVEQRTYWDQGDMMRQLGAAPPG